MPVEPFPFYSTEKKGSHKRSDTNMFEPKITHIFPQETYGKPLFRKILFNKRLKLHQILKINPFNKFSRNWNLINAH